MAWVDSQFGGMGGSSRGGGMSLKNGGFSSRPPATLSGVSRVGFFPPRFFPFTRFRRSLLLCIGTVVFSFSVVSGLSKQRVEHDLGKWNTSLASLS